MSRPALAAALVLAVLLAGCQDKGPTTVEVAPGQVVELSEAPKPSKGIVSGLVGDDALYPLPGASIFILGLGLNTTTDKSGRFAIVDVPPGLYVVEGSKKDHATTQTTVDVQPGEVAKAVLLLARAPPTDPYHTTFAQEAYADLATPFVYENSGNMTLPFELDDARARTLVLESAWSGTVYSTEANVLDYWLECGERQVLGEAAPNPFTVRVDARVLPPQGRMFHFGEQPRPATVFFQATGHLYVTVFYNEEAPPQWSILAGST